MKRSDIIIAAIAIALGGTTIENADANVLANEMLSAKSVALADMKK